MLTFIGILFFVLAFFAGAALPSAIAVTFWLRNRRLERQLDAIHEASEKMARVKAQAQPGRGRRTMWD